MKIILVRQSCSQARTINMSGVTLLLALLTLVVCVAATAGFASYRYLYAEGGDILSKASLITWREEIEEQTQELDLLKQHSAHQLDAMAAKVSQLQSRIVRIDALGERMTHMAKLDDGEFDFSVAPALGGPETLGGQGSFEPPSFMQQFDELSQRIESRESQLEVIEGLMGSIQLADDQFIAGRPIKKGWMSSSFGRRTDPFNGRIAWHNGVDFAGKDGSEVVSVAAGVVTWSGVRSGYGTMVEVNHGGGYLTRYAHNKENVAQVGDLIKKGQTIAVMGSSGRSTGPHVHFEVFRNGKAVDPKRYIHRASR